MNWILRHHSKNQQRWSFRFTKMPSGRASDRKSWLANPNESKIIMADTKIKSNRITQMFKFLSEDRECLLCSENHWIRIQTLWVRLLICLERRKEKWQYLTAMVPSFSWIKTSKNGSSPSMGKKTSIEDQYLKMPCQSTSWRLSKQVLCLMKMES